MPILSDNYAYLLVDPVTKKTACVDPAEPEKVHVVEAPYSGQGVTLAVFYANALLHDLVEAIAPVHLRECASSPVRGSPATGTLPPETCLFFLTRTVSERLWGRVSCPLVRGCAGRKYVERCARMREALLAPNPCARDTSRAPLESLYT